MGPGITWCAILLAFFGPWKKGPRGRGTSLLYQVSSTEARSWGTGCGTSPRGKPRISTESSG